MGPYMTPPPGGHKPEGGRENSTSSIPAIPTRVHALAWTPATPGSSLVGFASLTDLTRVWTGLAVTAGPLGLVLSGLPAELQGEGRQALDRLVLSPEWRRARRCA